MTVAGLWHGAGWTFILWGFVNGLWLAIERHSRGDGEAQRVARVLRLDQAAVHNGEG